MNFCDYICRNAVLEYVRIERVVCVATFLKLL